MTYKEGWEAGPGGGNMVRNTTTGQVVDIFHPVYTSAPDTLAPPPTSPTNPASSGPVVQKPLEKPVATAPTIGAFSYVPPGLPQTSQPAATGGVQSTAQSSYPAGSSGGPIQDQRTALVQNLLANPYTLNDQTVNQIKEQGKEQATALYQQLAQKMQEDAAARGLSSRGGFVAGNESKLGEDLASTLTKGNREVDLQRAATNRDDLLNALGASDQFLNSDLSRALQVYQGQLAGANQNLNAYQTDLGGYFSRLDAERGDKALATQAALGQGGLDLDRQRLSEQGRQFDLAQALALQQFMENQRQFNGQLGLGYNTLDQNGQQMTLDKVLDIYRNR